MKEFLNNVDFFNVSNLQKSELGYTLGRYPREILSEINHRAAIVSEYSDGCELRFVPMGGCVRIVLMAENSDGTVTVMRGDRTERVLSVKQGVFTSVDIDGTNLDKIKNPEFFKNDIYAKEVVRLVFGGARFIISSIDTFGYEIRPPKKDELPRYTALAYGSSITHGSNAVAANLNYISTAASRLNTQILNKGLGGSCFMEKVIADWFKAEIEYNYMIFEAGTNMAGVFDEKIIEERGTYMLNSLFEKNPDKYIFLITPMIPVMKNDNPDEYERYENAVYSMQRNVNCEKCILIPYENIETNTTFISTDGIHPSTEAHISMGINLSEIIKEYIE